MMCTFKTILCITEKSTYTNKMCFIYISLYCIVFLDIYNYMVYNFFGSVSYTGTVLNFFIPIIIIKKQKTIINYKMTTMVSGCMNPA